MSEEQMPGAQSLEDLDDDEEQLAHDDAPEEERVGEAGLTTGEAKRLGLR